MLITIERISIATYTYTCTVQAISTTTATELLYNYISVGCAPSHTSESQDLTGTSLQNLYRQAQAMVADVGLLVADHRRVTCVVDVHQSCVAVLELAREQGFTEIILD